MATKDGILSIASTSLSPELVDSFGNPEWQVERRRKAVDAALGMEWPTTELEEWRYSRIDDLNPATLSAPPTSRDGVALPDAVARLHELMGDAAAVMITIDGVLVMRELARNALDAGLVFDEETQVGIDSPEAPTTDLPSALNSAFSAAPLSLVVPPNTELDRPVVVINYLTRDATTFPRLTVSSGANSHVNVLVWSGSDETAAVTVPRLHADVGEGARLTITEVQNHARTVNQLGVASGTVHKDATLRLMHVALGGDYARTRFDCDLEGRGSRGDLTALYLGSGDQMHDIRTFQNHRGRDTTSDLVFKGAVGGDSHSVYTGLIHVGPEARGTDASQTNRNLKLSETAWAESVPNLEIENNEVKCSHASTVGPIDPDEQFYLESRGVPSDIASRLVVSGFFNEVIAAIPQHNVGDYVKDLIDSELVVVA